MTNKTNNTIDISSKQIILNLFLIKKKNWIDVAEIFSLQDYINSKNDPQINMDISFEDIKRTVQYHEEFFVMMGYRILLRKGKTDYIKNYYKLPKKISKLIEDYINKPPLFNELIEDV
jgi:hypothetical protein